MPPAARNARSSRNAPARKPFPVVPLVLGLVVLLAVVAVVVSLAGGDDDDVATDASGAAVEQHRPVEIDGEVLPRFEATAGDPAIGTVAPAVDGATFAGEPVAIAEDGRPKVVVFLAHWCPHCQQEVPVLASWLAEHGLPADVELYGVATGTDEGLPNYPPSAWLEREGFDVTTLADDAEGTTADAFGLSAFPYFVALDADHRVVARASGGLTTEQWEALLDLAAAN